MQKAVERRTHKRFHTDDGAFVFFSSKPAMSGRILDVSSAGIAFTYLASKRRTDESFNLDMWSSKYGLRFEGIPVKTISDFKQPGETSNSSRRCGVRFEQLTEKQQIQLEEFIGCCTTGEA